MDVHLVVLVYDFGRLVNTCMYVALLDVQVVVGLELRSNDTLNLCLRISLKREL